jgi:hypothetical protein
MQSRFASRPAHLEVGRAFPVMSNGIWKMNPSSPAKYTGLNNVTLQGRGPARIIPYGDPFARRSISNLCPYMSSSARNVRRIPKSFRR